VARDQVEVGVRNGSEEQRRRGCVMAVRLVHGRMKLGCGPDLALKFGWRGIEVEGSQAGGR
jgi:hypothetical protein